jgi:DNA-binding transcriptional ArsR family regulator
MNTTLSLVLTTILVYTKIIRMVEIFGALNTPRRREILRFVWNEERSAGEIFKANPDITFGAVSQHLRILEQAGLVNKRREGLHQFYKARRDEMGPLQTWLESMWDSALYRLKINAEMEQARRGPRSRKKRSKK